MWVRGYACVALTVMYQLVLSVSVKPGLGLSMKASPPLLYNWVCSFFKFVIVVVVLMPTSTAMCLPTDTTLACKLWVEVTTTPTPVR